MSKKDISKEFVEQDTKYKELTAALTIFRHYRELRRIEELIAQNKQIPTEKENKVKRAIIDNTVNAYRRKTTQKLSDQKQQCLNSIAAVKAKYSDIGIILGENPNEEELKKLIDGVFTSDKFGFQKISFAMNFCLGDGEAEEEFIFGDETLKGVSRLLFGDETRIESIKENFFENFKELYSGNFWERNKYILIGAGISLAFISVIAPLALELHTLSSAVVTSCLSQIGHCAPGIIGAGIAKVTAMTVSSAVILFGGVLAGVGVAELIENKNVKEAFRQLKPEDLAALLAMKATLMSFGMENMDDEECKNELDKCLSYLNDLRADSEYTLIVEKLDADSNKKKIRICNRFVDRLALRVGI